EAQDRAEQLQNCYTALTTEFNRSPGSTFTSKSGRGPPENPKHESHGYTSEDKKSRPQPDIVQSPRHRLPALSAPQANDLDRIGFALILRRFVTDRLALDRRNQRSARIGEAEGIVVAAARGGDLDLARAAGAFGAAAGILFGHVERLLAVRTLKANGHES